MSCIVQDWPDLGKHCSLIGVQKQKKQNKTQRWLIGASGFEEFLENAIPHWNLDFKQCINSTLVTVAEK